jgi:hypothetical protein
MSRVDLYPSKNSSPADAQVQTGTVAGTKVGADVQVLGGTIITGSAAVPAAYDNGTLTLPSATQEVYKYYTGATLVRTITINYTDSTKAVISSWTIS